MKRKGFKIIHQGNEICPALAFFSFDFEDPKYAGKLCVKITTTPLGGPPEERWTVLCAIPRENPAEPATAPKSQAVAALEATRKLTEAELQTLENAQKFFQVVPPRSSEFVYINDDDQPSCKHGTTFDQHCGMCDAEVLENNPEEF